MTDWMNLLPPQLARNQMAWEKDRALLRALEAGATAREMANKMGVTLQTVYNRLNRARDRPNPPVERYLTSFPEVRDLAALLHRPPILRKSRVPVVSGVYPHPVPWSADWYGWKTEET